MIICIQSPQHTLSFLTMVLHTILSERVSSVTNVFNLPMACALQKLKGGNGKDLCNSGSEIISYFKIQLVLLTIYLRKSNCMNAKVFFVKYEISQVIWLYCKATQLFNKAFQKSSIFKK